MTVRNAKLPITVQLSGEDGNAFNVMGIVTSAMKKQGFGYLVDEYLEEAMSGSYENLLSTTTKWVNVK